jgi:hypothetical protein
MEIHDPSPWLELTNVPFDIAGKATATQVYRREQLHGRVNS